jgi:putative phosphoserine phosphatase/1-acylglycerol-3-phosphate O-acyltransferase
MGRRGWRGRGLDGGEIAALYARLVQEIREGPGGSKIGAFFDVDRTLLAGFSAVAFLRERVVSGRMSARELAQSLLGSVGYALGRTGFSGLVAAHAAAYRGLAESALQELGEEVFEKYLATAIYPESRAILRAHQERGHTVAIVSSATPYQVEPLARDLGVKDVLCTRLEVVDGALTGRVLRPTCFGEGKRTAVEALAARRDLDLEQSFFYSDSHDDLPLLERVGRPRPLNPDKGLGQVAKERRWPVQRFRSRGRPGVTELARTGLAWWSIVPSALAGLGVGLVNRSHRDGLNVAASLWGDLSIALSGIDLRVEGEEHLWSRRPAVFIFNHQSGLDAPLMVKMVRRDLTGIGKQEIRWHPVFGPVFWAAGMVFVDRGDTARAIEAMKPAVEALSQGRSIVVAPEGTRRPTPRLGRFKKGAFHLAMQAGVPIVPVVFRNVLDALPKGGVVIHPTTIEAVVLPPVETSHWTRDTLDAEIEAIRRRYLEILEG